MQTDALAYITKVSRYMACKYIDIIYPRSTRIYSMKL